MVTILLKPNPLLKLQEDMKQLLIEPFYLFRTLIYECGARVVLVSHVNVLRLSFSPLFSIFHQIGKMPEMTRVRKTVPRILFLMLSTGN